MKRISLFIIVALSLIGIVFFGRDLLQKSEVLYAPEFIFSEEDQSVFLLHRSEEIQNTGWIEQFNNPLALNLSAIDWTELSDVGVYISYKRPILIFNSDFNWKNKQIESLKNSIKSSNTSVFYAGRYALVVDDSLSIQPNETPISVFSEFDKKASANLWTHQREQGWKRTDIYSLDKGYFEYISQRTTKQLGSAVHDVELFSSIIPQNIEQYVFHERFYAAEKDSVLNESPMSTWLDKGFVELAFKEEKVLITDYRTQQLPSLILLEKSIEEDSLNYEDQIKSFVGFQLTKSFPTEPNGRFYAVTIEDKTVFSENKSTLEEILLRYNLGETLALNEQKRNQLFGDLPQKSHYRYIDRERKESITFKNDLRFTVATLPPGEELVMTVDNNWSFNPGFDKIQGMVPVSDHLRGGHSLFVYDSRGNYKLISQTGAPIWEGKADSSLLFTPKIIDVFENNKKQLLFTTAKNLYLIDLNGNDVGSFPYRSDYSLSSNVSTFKWNGTLRFLIGNQKGELIMLNNTGKELNVVQIHQHPVQATPFALNVAGNLRAWVIDQANQTYLAYLETPARREGFGKSSASEFMKTGKEVSGLTTENGKVSIEKMDKTTQLVGEGKFLGIENDLVILQNKNELSFFNFDGKLIYPLVLSFNEVGRVIPFVFNQKRFTLVFDYLGNKVYLYDSSGVVYDDFPKEARQDISMSIDKEARLLNVFTVLNNNIFCYKIKLDV